MRRPAELVARRRFLRLLSGAPLLAGIAGCGGGSRPQSTPTNPNLPPVSDTTRQQSLAAVRGFVNSIIGLNRDERVAQKAAFLKSRPEFVASGTNRDGAWAFYQDGVPLMLLDNREPEEVDLSRAVPAGVFRGQRAQELPASDRVRLIHTLGNAFTNHADIVRPLFQEGGYTVVNDPGTIASLKLIQDDGVTFFSGHGGICRVPLYDDKGNLERDEKGQILVDEPFGFWTAERVDPANPNRYLDEIKAGRVGMGFARHDLVGGVPAEEEHYYITDAFIRDYIRFGQNSLVWWNACLSLSDESAVFRDACHQKGAGLYVGWSNYVRDGACVVVNRFVLDRLTGANVTNPMETPPQRPFSYKDVFDDLRKRGLHLHPSRNGGTTEVRYSLRGSEFALLTPSLKDVLVDEAQDRLILRGIFGNPPPQDRLVLVDGVALAIELWTDAEIHASIPRTGDGSAGAVQVLVGNRRSNPRRLTAWDLLMDVRINAGTSKALGFDGPMRLRFRMDVETDREQIAEKPKDVVRSASIVFSSKAIITASGVESDEEYRNVFSGTYEFSPFELSTSGGKPYLAGYLQVDTSRKEALLYAFVFPGSPVPPDMTDARTDRDGHTTIIPLPFPFSTVVEDENDFVTLRDPLRDADLFLKFPVWRLTMDENFNIAAQEKKLPGDSGTVKWAAISAQFPPDLNGTRSPFRR